MTVGRSSKFPSHHRLLHENRIKYIDMGRRAMDYYYSKATNEIKAEGVIDAINYVIS